MQRIASLPSVLAIYEKELIADNLLTEADATALKQEHFNLLDKSLADAEKFTIPKFEMPERWNGMRFPTAGEWETEKVETGVDEGLLKEIGLRSTQVPNDFVSHFASLSFREFPDDTPNRRRFILDSNVLTCRNGSPRSKVGMESTSLPLKLSLLDR